MPECLLCLAEGPGAAACQRKYHRGRPSVMARPMSEGVGGSSVWGGVAARGRALLAFRGCGISRGWRDRSRGGVESEFRGVQRTGV